MPRALGARHLLRSACPWASTFRGYAHQPLSICAWVIRALGSSPQLAWNRLHTTIFRAFAHRAPPNPIAQAERQRQATRPGLAVRGTFSPARAWRPTVVARLAFTLGVNQIKLGQAIVSKRATRRLHAAATPAFQHRAARPRGASPSSVSLSMVIYLPWLRSPALPHWRVGDSRAWFFTSTRLEPPAHHDLPCLRSPRAA